jgi:SanA protein
VALKTFRTMLTWLLIAVIALPALTRVFTALNAANRVFAKAADAPAERVAIVFGAGVRNGYPTAMLYDRVAAAVELYKAGKVQKLLMSGDNRFENYNEPAAMRRTALQLGVPDGDIALDLAGRSTYDTCYRAKEIFSLDSAILVTQRFHLDRALMLCDAVGIKASGYNSDRRAYRALWWNHLREVPATLNAVIEAYVTRPKPVLGDKIAIK